MTNPGPSRRLLDGAPDERGGTVSKLAELRAEQKQSAAALHAPAWAEALTVISPTQGWRALDLAELARRTDLLAFLVWRDLKVRYQQTLLGGLWAILQPLAAAAAFTFVFGRLAKMPSDGFPYPLFSLVGLVVWTFFAGALNAAVNSLVANRQLVSKVYFPRLLLPVSAAMAGLVDLAIGLLCVGLALAAYGRPPPATALLVLPLTLAALGLAAGLGAGLGAINVRFRDVRATMPLFLQLWLFLTPIAYPASLAPAAWRPLLGINPMAGVIEGCRWALLGGPAPAGLMAVSAVSGTIAVAAGLAVFRNMESSFADVI